MRFVAVLLCLLGLCVMMGTQSIAQDNGDSHESEMIARKKTKKSHHKKSAESATAASALDIGGSKRRGGVPKECCSKPGDEPDGDHK
ncbi:hypothetical protein [Paraburkholderia aromaticivorans]|uniref:hypothetical protein n=1 Tax=Paraburkholderia aromaticivorans TaxID=2026199 RepID=UPI001455E329|nr:hypothetical protein [Paraburkholderia aromaticivorans]